MKHRVRVIDALVVMLLVPSAGVAAQAQCPSTGVAVQVLGSGGPRGGVRASSSYLLWVEGRSRVMVDVGGGSFLRFGEAGARLSDLDLLAISHFHPDHVSDLPGLLWLSDTQREAALRIAGPYGSEAFPSLDGFLSRLFDAQAGAFQVLSGTLGGPGRGVLLDPVAPDPGRSGPTVVLDREDIIVRALPVPHGAVPALAYRVEVNGASVVFSSDQNGSDPRFVEFSRGATALVMHFATRSPGSALHASPEVVGQVAADAGVQQLILSHLFSSEPVEGARRYNLAYLEGSVAQVRARYSGVVRVGEDLACYAL